MPTPLVAVTGRFFAPDQTTPAQGEVDFVLTALLPVVGDRVYDTETVTAALDPEGNLTAADGGPLELVPSDPAGSTIAAPGVTYRITTRFTNARSGSWETYIPAANPTVDITLLAPAAAPALVAVAPLAALDIEEARRIAADLALQGDIDDDLARAETAEEALGGRIDGEHAAWQAGDTAATAAAVAQAEAYTDNATQIDIVDGVPTLTTYEAFDLDSFDSIPGPWRAGDNGTIVASYGDAGIAIVVSAAWPLATVTLAQTLANAAQALATAAAEAYADLELGLHTSAGDPHPQYALDTDLAAYQARSEKGAPNGYATLDSSGTVPAAQMPALAIGDTWVVHSQAAMLALAAQRGDVAVRDDIDPAGPVSFRLAADDPTVLGNWKQLNYPGDVVTVNGRSGIVTGLAEQASLDATNANVTANTASITANTSAIAALPTFNDVLALAVALGG